MALHGKFGKDRVEKSSESYISEALHGGSGPSEGIHDTKVDRPHQSINTAVALDNVTLAMDIKSSILDDKFAGGVDNLEHSLTGSSAVNEKIGAASKLKETIIPNH
jgi:hypothetical protein